MPLRNNIHFSLQLGGIGSQHREAQGEESKKFRSYFDQIVVLPGRYGLISYMHACVDHVSHKVSNMQF